MVTHGVHRILVVDNESLIVEELTEYLSGCGFECLGCLDGAEALALFQQHADIRIVLTDYRMPGMNGVELLQRLREVASDEHVFEGALFTGNAEKEDVIAALRAGVSDYFQKPLDLDELLAGVQRLVERVDLRVKKASVHHISAKLQDLSESLAELYEGIHSLGGNETGQLSETERRKVTAPGFEKLSPRQVEVARLIAKGQTNYQISCELGISENTVKLYVSQILRATNMPNRTRLALVLGGQG